MTLVIGFFSKRTDRCFDNIVDRIQAELLRRLTGQLVDRIERAKML